tara:strand:- start:1762 stop:1959 length:198 start_codon:yes stop_codon:yes gene_type:complete
MRRMSDEAATAIFALQQELDKAKVLIKMFIDHFALTDAGRDVLVNRGKKILGETNDSEGTFEDIS